MGECAKLYRFLEFIPLLLTLCQYQVRSGEDWFDYNQNILLNYDILRRYTRINKTAPSSLGELKRVIQQYEHAVAIDDSDLLIVPAVPRAFHIGRIIPLKVEDLFNPRAVLNKLILEDINGGESCLNRNLIDAAFPGLWSRKLLEKLNADAILDLD